SGYHDDSDEDLLE
nr:Chain C, C-terminal fragment of Sortilin [synthetic construct]3G2U_D Chain D, C-terminal fragment of Sortilin [synthetic construct]